jgi:TRAP-type C4-dicarboxylate transport system substrate-binding protein
MALTRRTILAGALSMPALLPGARQVQAATTLKISHQFPGGTAEQGDVRDRFCRLFAAEVEKRTNGTLKFDIYANASLMKTNAQFSALRRGALDMSLYPIAYAGGELHACNLGLMPCLVTSYEQGAAWKTADVGKALSGIVESKGVQFISWIWQAGGVASRRAPVLSLADVKGVKIRGGSREMDLMFAAAGGQVSTMPSNEIYIGMQTSSLDAAVTSSTSLISFRLEELAKSLTAARKGSFWFMLEPLLMSKAIFDRLPPDQKAVLLDVGTEMEAWAMAQAKKDDEAVAAIYAAKGVQVSDFTAANLAEWRQVAEASAWKDYAARSSEAADLLKLAQKVA